MAKTIEQMMIRSMVRGVYDIQKLRIASGQKILAQTLVKLGLPPEIPVPITETKDEKKDRLKRKKERDAIVRGFLEKLGITPVELEEEEEEPKGKKKPKQKMTDFFQILIQDYKGIIDYLTNNKGSVDKAIKNAGIGIISDQSEYEILKAYFLLVESEETLIKPLKRAVESHPLWINFLKDVKGCGTLMAGVILSEFDITKAHYVSSFWKYMGGDTVIKLDKDGNPIEELDLNGDPMVRKDSSGEPILDEMGNTIPIYVMEGRSKKERHQVDLEYINKKGEVATRKSITYNPFLKTKLFGVLGSCFLRSGGYYADIYYGYKNRLNQEYKHDNKTDGHKHAMANRYMIKYFVQDLFVAWCLVTGRTPTKPYHEEKLDMRPHSKISPALLPLLKEKAPFMIVA